MYLLDLKKFCQSIYLRLYLVVHCDFIFCSCCILFLNVAYVMTVIILSNIMHVRLSDANKSYLCTYKPLECRFIYICMLTLFPPKTHVVLHAGLHLRFFCVFFEDHGINLCDCVQNCACLDIYYTYMVHY